MRRILKILALIVLLAYLVTSFILWGNKDSDIVCQHFYISVTDSAKSDLISADDLYAYIGKAHLSPQGKTKRDINTAAIERCVREIDLLKEVECYQEDNGDVYLKVSQRNPIMRVYTDEGKTYYIDDNGKELAVDTMYVDYVPLVTGYVDDTLSAQMLIPLIEYITGHDFWRAQVTQIAITPQHEVLLHPRVGDQVLALGSLDNYENKMRALLAIYEQIIPQVGWNVYDTISVKYKDQIVCSRQDKKYRHKIWTKKKLSSYE